MLLLVVTISAIIPVVVGSTNILRLLSAVLEAVSLYILTQAPPTADTTPTLYKTYPLYPTIVKFPVAPLAIDDDVPITCTRDGNELLTDALIVPSPVIEIPDPILTPPNITDVAVCKVKLPVVTEIVPSCEIETPDPILTPPSEFIVAVVNVNCEAVVALIVPSLVIEIPVPILTPPNITDVAVCKAKLPVVTEIVPSCEIETPVPIFTPPN